MLRKKSEAFFFASFTKISLTMAIILLIFLAAVASVVSAAPKIYSYPDEIQGSINNEYNDHVIVPWTSIPVYDYEVQYEGQSNEHNVPKPKPNENGPKSKTCRPSEAQKNVAGMDEWCNSNCFHNPPYCPESHCHCY